MPLPVPDYSLGIRLNLRLFLQQLLQVFFVGMTIELQRTVLPTLAETEFGFPEGSFTLLLSIAVSFGFVKRAMHFVSEQLSRQIGRRLVLIARRFVAGAMALSGLWPGIAMEETNPWQNPDVDPTG